MELPRPPPLRPPVLTFPAKSEGVKETVCRNLKKICSELSAKKQTPTNEVRDLILAMKHRNVDEKKWYLSTYTSLVAPLVQEGPQCGLVALSLAGQRLGHAISTDQFLDLARTNGWSKLGEMFSAEAVLALAKELFGCHGKVVDLVTEQGCLVAAILEKQPVLMPYDRYANGEPCCKKGHKAHWALLPGVLFVSSHLPADIANYFSCDTELPELLHQKSDISLTTSDLDLSQTGASTWVFAKEGKSLRTHLWSLESLVASNHNLNEVDPAIIAKSDEYVLPPDGRLPDLKDKAVILWQ